MKPEISYLPQKAIDRTKWDACIQQSGNGLVYGTSWYLDVVCNNWDALVLGDYEAVFPLPFNSKYGLFYSLQPLFCQQLGLFSTSAEGLARLPDFLAAIPKKFLVLKLNLNDRNTGITSAKPRLNYILNLKHDYDTIRKNYSSTCRKRVRKSKEAGTTLKTGIGTDMVIDLYRLNLAGRDVLSSDQFELIHRLLNTAQKHGCLLTIGVFDENDNICATAGLIKDHHRFYYVCGGTNQKGRETFANMRIIDHVIGSYAGQDMVFDFEGSEIPAIADFFRHFGPAETHYFFYERNLLPWPVNRFIK